MPRALRYAIVAALTLFALVSVYFAASAFWAPRGTIGIATDYNARIRGVIPGSPAALAGLVPHDRVDLSQTPYRMRRYVAGVGASPRIGAHVRLAIIRDGTDRNFDLVAVPSEMTPADRSVLFFECAAALVFIVVGASLILLRPSAATWGFGLYCLIILPTAPSPFLFPIAHGAVALLLGYDVLQIVGVVGLIVFVLEFPRPLPSPWRVLVRRSLPAIFVVLSAMILYPDVANQLLGRGVGPENEILQIVLGLTFLLALLIALDTYRRIETTERDRVRWVVAGLWVGLAASYVGETVIYSPLFPIAAPAWLLNLLASLNVLLPLAIAHAVVRKRVLDIDFVISHAIIYTAFTVILVVIFALCDWGFAHLLEDFRLSLLVNAAISVGIAFAFDTLQGRAERLIESVLFHKRFLAQTRLRDLARHLRVEQSANVVEEALTRSAADALELTSSALFRRSGELGLIRVAATGWDSAHCTRINDGDELVRTLCNREEALSLGDAERNHPEFPRGTQMPIVAIPLWYGAQLQGIALYGGHVHGGDLDSEELDRLEQVVESAGTAFSDIEAARLRALNDALQTRLAALERASSAPR